MSASSSFSQGTTAPSSPVEYSSDGTSGVGTKPSSFFDELRDQSLQLPGSRAPPPLFDFKPQELFEHAPGIKHRLVPEWYAKRQQQQS